MGKPVEQEDQDKSAEPDQAVEGSTGAGLTGEASSRGSEGPATIPVTPPGPAASVLAADDLIGDEGMPLPDTAHQQREANTEQPESNVKVIPIPQFEKLERPVKGRTDKYGYLPHDELHQKNKAGEFTFGKSTGYLNLKVGNAKHPAKTGADLSKIEQSGPAAPPPVDGAPSTSSGSSTPSHPPAPVAAPFDPEKARMCARVMTDMFFNLNVTAFGKDFQPVKLRDAESGQDVNERENMRLAMELYCEQKGIQDIPAGIVLVSVMGAYYGARFGAPEVREKTKKSLIGSLVFRTKCWIVDRKARKAKRNMEAERNGQPEQYDHAHAPHR